MQQTPVPVPEVWEVAKGVMLSLSTLGVGYLVRTIRSVELRMREIEIVVSGVDGKNGLRSAARDHHRRLERIEERNDRIDAVAEYEKHNYQGPERRQTSRRLRDQEFPNPLEEAPDTNKEK